MLWLFKRRRRKGYTSPPESSITVPQVPENEVLPGSAPSLPDSRYPPETMINFAANLSRYKGKTVTIFVSSGGLSGFGFTGILLDVCSAYIQLITSVGPAPSCALGNSCGYCNPVYNYHGFFYPYIRQITSLGSIACIPVNKISAFVHTSSKP